MEIRYSLIPLFLLLIAGKTHGFEPKAIKQFQLDERTVYQIKIAKDQITTITFPGKLTALEGAGITGDPQVPAPVLIHYKEGRSFFSVRALTDSASGSLNVVWNRKTYVLKLLTSKEPVNSVTFYESGVMLDTETSKDKRSPERLLNLLDRVKAYPLIRDHHPDLISQIETTAPNNRIYYKDFDVVLAEVYRFDEEDVLIFKVLFYNNSEHEIYYQPQTLAVRVGHQVHFSALSDASGLIPSGSRASDTKQIHSGVSIGYFAIVGSPSGGRNNLSVSNKFNVIVNRCVQ